MKTQHLDAPWWPVAVQLISSSPSMLTDGTISKCLKRQMNIWPNWCQFLIFSQGSVWVGSGSWSWLSFVLRLSLLGRLRRLMLMLLVIYVSVPFIVKLCPSIQAKLVFLNFGEFRWETQTSLWKFSFKSTCDNMIETSNMEQNETGSRSESSPASNDPGPGSKENGPSTWISDIVNFDLWYFKYSSISGAKVTQLLQQEITWPVLLPHSEGALLYRPEEAPGPRLEPHTQLLPGTWRWSQDRSLVTHTNTD